MPEQIQTKLIEEEMKESYIDYSMSVIVGRALPDVHDGLKPVHRRILYSMYRLGLLHNKPFKKSARIVGECFTKDTLVLTTRGLVPIINIERGDFVYTQSGLEEVKELYEMPKKEILDVTLDNGISNKVTKSQKFKILNKDLEFEWKNAENLTDKDYLVLRASYPKINENVKLNLFNNRYIELNENLGYLLGHFLSDGWIEKSTNRIFFYSISKEVIDKISSILIQEFGYIAKIEDKSYEFESVSGNLSLNQAYQIRINNKIINLFLASTFNLFNKDAFSKEIPNQIMISPKSVIYSFISGLIDGDGSIHKSRNIVRYGSISENMINQLLLITQQLGVIGKKFKAKKIEGHLVNNRMLSSNKPFFYIEWRGQFSKNLCSNLNLFCEVKKQRAEKLKISNEGKSRFEVIPFASKILFEELSKKHIGAGWYKDKNGKKFRLGIKYSTGSKIRYSRNLKEKELRRSQIIGWNIKEKLNKINSKYSKFVNEVFEKDIFFIKVKFVNLLEPQQTYDIQTGNSHEFIANGFVSHNCLGKYHPHGDIAVYDSLVRMAQGFSLRYPLIDGQGNFGSVDGDSAAAQRYTESRLSRFAEDIIADIDKETVKFVANYDNTEREPIILPGKLPNLLINGSAGIAVGMATNMPPHNIGEVCDAIIKTIENPQIEVEELLNYIKGPDFPTGAIISGRGGIISAYKTGRGHIRVKARAQIKDKKIIVSEIPYQVNKSMLIEDIANQIRDKKIEGISDIRDESDRRGMRIVFELRQNASAEVVLNQLYRNSQLSNTFSVINLALVAGQPKILNLRDLIISYIKHRKRIVTRRTEYELRQAESRAHILAGLKIALSNIDDVVKTIKSSNTPEAAKASLIKVYKLSADQSQAILEMRLSRLTSLEINKVKSEFDELTKLIADLKSILASEQKIYAIIKKELQELKDKYGDERKTEVLEGEEELDDEALIKEEDVVVTVSHHGYIKRIPAETYKAQRRGGKGIIASELKEEDFIEHLFVTNTHAYMLFFTDKGRVYWLKGYRIPSASRYSRGVNIVNILEMQKDEKISAMIPIKEFRENEFLIMCTKKGVVKKTSLLDYSNPRKGGIIAVSLRDLDRLVTVKKTNGEQKYIIATKNGFAVRFDEKQIRSIGRSGMGVRGIRLSSGDEVIGMELATNDDDTLLTITENGYGKRSLVSEYRIIGRGGKGVINIKTSGRNGKVVAIKTVKDDHELMCITKNGIIIRTNASDISTIGRNTQGVRIMKIDDKDKVINLARIINNHNSNH